MRLEMVGVSLILIGKRHSISVVGLYLFLKREFYSHIGDMQIFAEVGT
jgi:hypothetical protein